MMLKLFLVFALVPLIEIYLFITIGGAIGAPATIAIVLLTALVGAWLARQQGASALKRIQATMAQGAMPANEMIDGVLILAAGLVLLTPGFFTDAIGFALLIPQTRNAVRAWARQRLEAATRRGSVTVVRYR